ncbi:MAG: SRPBCC family protein [Leptolyngbyaceae cyanobacterium]
MSAGGVMANATQVFEQSIQIATSATLVEHCITDRGLMHQWLNPALRCEPWGETWNTELGGKSRFVVQVPLLEPTLVSTVVERRPGLIVWAFKGFFVGRDRWECQPNAGGTQLVNRFEFTIHNPLVAFGFNTFAATWTKQDMEAQLQRLKQVAERLKVAK